MAKDYDSSFTVEETQAQLGKWLQQSLWQIMTELRTNWNCSHSPPSCLRCSVPDSRTPASHRLLQCPVQGYAWDKRGGEEPEEEQGENEREGERKVENGNTE